MTTAPQDDVARANHALLVKFYDAVARGDLAAGFGLLGDDIEWRVHRPSPAAGTYHGKQEVQDWFGRMAAPYEGTLQVSTPAMVVDEHHGFVLVRESAERPAPVSYTGVHAWQFAGGKICRFESYYDESYIEFWSARSSCPDTALSVARRYHEGWSSGNYDEAIALLSPALTVEVPINQYPDAVSFAEALRGFGELVDRVEVLSEMTDGQEAMLLYDMDVRQLGELRVAEHFTVTEGKITRLRQVHDTAPVRAAGLG